MCCRYYMEMSPTLRPIVEQAQRSRIYTDNVARVAKPVTTEGEVFPGAMVPVLATSRAGRKTAFPMIWGYNVQGISRLIVNARSETAQEKQSFKEGWAAHRCVIPASWYYEWEHRLSPAGKPVTGEKYAIQPRGQQLTWLCGLYRMEDGLPHFVVLTRDSGESIAFLHDRMPLILPEQDVDRWIDPCVNPHMLLDSALTDMVFAPETQS